MADDAGTRLRNVSDYGDIEVPDLGLIIESKHEIVIADADLAQRLVDTGAFIAVGKPGPKTTSTDTGTDPTPPADTAAATPSGDASTTTSPTGAETDTTTGEEPTSDHAA